MLQYASLIVSRDRAIQRCEMRSLTRMLGRCETQLLLSSRKPRKILNKLVEYMRTVPASINMLQRHNIGRIRELYNKWLIHELAERNVHVEL